MATIKLFTDLQQSKKLAEILPIESADMYYCYGMNIDTKVWSFDSTPTIIDTYNQIDIGDIPCWSLSALLGVFPFYEINNNGVNIQLSVKGEALITEKEECLLDLAVNMIINLHELKML